MREIKFRAWDMIGRVMYKPAAEAEALALRSIELMNDDKGYHLIWLQYTGLKDKNDVEIYDGDVIRISGVYASDKFAPFVVEYQDHMASFYPRSINGYEPDESWWQDWTIEVIGNIYENPELLRHNND